MFGGIKGNVYLCNAKIKVRYDDAATTGGYFCICHIRIKTPLGLYSVGKPKGSGGFAL
jgi:hypothetical protein